MNYIIDGHNLIAKIPGLNLRMVDDEERLISLLNLYGELNRGKYEVYFDGAPEGQAGARSYGRVRAHFVPQSQTADETIKVRLSKLGKSARNWVVVTSDRSVQAAAHEVHASVLKSEDFARQLTDSVRAKAHEAESKPYQPLSPSEVDEWLATFRTHQKPK